MKNTAVMTLRFNRNNTAVDIEVPLDISANELVTALNQAFGLGIDTTSILECCLKTEHPIAFLRGSKRLQDYGLHNGTIINIM